MEEKRIIYKCVNHLGHSHKMGKVIDNLVNKDQIISQKIAGKIIPCCKECNQPLQKI